MLNRRQESSQSGTLIVNTQASPPVFIIAPAHRSGTNYLASILLLHKNFQLPTNLWEDYVLLHSPLLEKYAYQTSKSKGWDLKIWNDDSYPKSLLKHLGDGVLSFLYEQVEEDRRLLCKTPRGYNIGNFFRLFPGAKLLILVRDGRDVVQSAVKTGRRRLVAFEWFSYTWAKGARSILEFMYGSGRSLDGISWKYIKYEDLVAQPERVMRDMLPFLTIDVNLFDFSRLQDLPVIGSSFDRGGENKVHWNPIEKPRNFKPVGRWSNWGMWQKIIFKAIAGQELIRLGYVDNNNW